MVLQALKDGAGGVSIADLAKQLNWFTARLEPNKSKAQRTVTRLKKAKLVQLDRGRYALTDKGKKTARVAA
jgi:Mn-dependent DtxR family transcriptional regulator